VTLSDYLTAFKRGWWIVLGTLVLGLAVAAAMLARQPTVYSTSSQLFVTASVQLPRDGSGDWYDVAGTRVISYATVANGDLVAERVADLVGDTSGTSVSVAAIPNTVVISIGVQGPDAEVVADVADAYAAVLPSVIDEVEDREGGTKVELTPVAQADVPDAPDPRPVLATMGSAGILALGLGATLAILRQALRRDSRSTRAVGEELT
jgi:uncharacterized protein involved in exopolysaccharide biosynthesis